MPNETSGTIAGRTAGELAQLLGLPRVECFQAVPSTMDVAHEMAGAGAPAGSLVLADEQRSGRGRGGRRWLSEPGAGLWLTLIERPNDVRAAAVLSIRVGLALARAIDRYAGTSLGLKWPNDIFLGNRKLGGILVESRWRDGRLDWTAIGIGINLALPPGIDAAALGPAIDRLELLAEIVPAVRAAASARGDLSGGELQEFAARDIAAGAVALSPHAGRVAGIDTDGALLIVTAAGPVRCREGSLVLEEDRP